MNGNRITAVVLAVSGGNSDWGVRRFSEPIAGTAALARVRRALVDAGVSEIFLWTDCLDAVVGTAAWSGVLQEGSGEGLAAVGDRPLLAVCGDLPLLTTATVRALADASAKGRARRLVDASGVLAFWRTDADAASEIQTSASRFDALEGPFGRGTWAAPDASDVRRLDGPQVISELSAIARERIARALGAAGVLILDPLRTYVDDEAVIGADTVICPGTHVRGRTRIGSRCRVGPDSWIESSVIEDDAVVWYSVLEQARVRQRSTIGPFAHLRSGSDVGPDARVGNFVELKKARLGAGAKAGHLSYVGDADVGAGVNIGAGTITCNFDGESKHRTVIEDQAFIGSNASLVAPVTIGRGAVVGAGSTITEDVPPGTLAIARSRQVVKPRKADASGEDT